MENKHTPKAEKWFLNLSERNGDDYMELTLSEKYGGCSDEMGSKDYMRISGICSKERAHIIHAAPDMLEALKLAKEELTFLYAQNRNTEFWSEISEQNFSKINAAIKKAHPHE